MWSFGIVLYELFSRGRTPYFNLTNAEAAENVVAGYRKIMKLQQLTNSEFC